ncbi:hypothetical protein EJ06DRAFT_486154, partial [Trichodelitschia bisporula]
MVPPQLPTSNAQGDLAEGTSTAMDAGNAPNTELTTRGHQKATTMEADPAYPAPATSSDPTPLPDRKPQLYHRRKHGERLTLPTSRPQPSPLPTTRTRALSPSESGTEADDESFDLNPGGYGSGYASACAQGYASGPGSAHSFTGLVRALPAPAMRPRKGLRDAQDAGKGVGTGVSPLLTPTALSEDEGEERWRVRRRAEVVRRLCEVALVGFVGGLVVREAGVGVWGRAELRIAGAIVVGLCLLYPVRLVAYAWKRTAARRLSAAIRVPAVFDPAPLIYPLCLPIFVALSLHRTFPEPLLANIVLGLAALPPALIPGSWNSANGSYYLHWLLSTLPAILSAHTDTFSKISAPTPYALKTPPTSPSLETLTLLHPLHASLTPFLHSLTSTSLLPAELALTSTALINLTLFATTPPTTILSTLLIPAALLLTLLAGPALHAAVALSRIPRWRFRRAGQVVRLRQLFLAVLANGVRRARASTGPSKRPVVESDADDDEEGRRRPRPSLRRLGSEIMHALPPVFGEGPGGRRRRHTMPASGAVRVEGKEGTGRRRRGNPLLVLTPAQATRRKVLYAVYVYAVMGLIALGPARWVIQRSALGGAEPIGWLIGYFLGNIRGFRFWVFNHGLRGWIALPPLPDAETQVEGGWVEQYRQEIGAGTTRLWMCGYFILVVAAALGIVTRLASRVEVDTRRKVFHGTVVALLLPTTYIDPAFVSLALGAVLVLFLLLDLLRASTLPPIAKPLARFLAPYTDGRDWRGPVVVSHIFLLVGCAVPVWLSLAGREWGVGEGAWDEWEVRGRDLGLIAGVVCVGLGDAAASLVGRRVGRRKWPWVGG